MPLRIKAQAEPFTDFSKSVEPILAESEVYLRLQKDLKRYTDGLIQGRSYLIAGHRGSGKTTVVYKAIEDLIRSSVLGSDSRPLFVRLHGPDLLPPFPEPGEATDGEKKPTEKPATNGTARKPLPADADKPPVQAEPPTTAAAATIREKAKKQATANEELNTVLKLMVQALFRDVSNEFRRCYRETVLERPEGEARQNLLEVAAQFDLELTDYIQPARLRTFWHRLNALHKGILFNAERTKYKLYTAAGAEPRIFPATDVGLQEVLALSFLSQAFRLTSGTIEDIQRQKDEEKGERTSTLTTAYELKNLFAPIAALLSGGFVGVSTFSRNPVVAVFLGLLTGAVVQFAFSFKSVRSSSNELSLESVFKKDTSIATLSNVLPLIIMRLKQIGLAPVFVIDELDKVPDLEERMTNLVRHLKFLVTENSFSCFLVDRRYLNYLDRRATGSAYAPEYTYFSDRMAILYRPAELRKFVNDVLYIVPAEGPDANKTAQQIKTQKDQDEADLEKISFVLLHRARLHPIDLRRQLDGLIAKDYFSLADLFSFPRYRFEILIQVAVEWLLNGDDTQARVKGDPSYLQAVYDALYYVSRLWEDAAADSPQIPGHEELSTTSNEKKPGLRLSEKSFAEYLNSRFREEDDSSRTAQEKAEANDAIDPACVSGRDFDFLFRKVQQLLNYLSNPEDLVSDIERSPPEKRPPVNVLNEIPRQAKLRFLELTNEPRVYRWFYDVSGNYLHDRDVQTIMEEVGDAVVEIRELTFLLTKLGVPGDLQALADANLIPRSTAWRDEVLPALDRLDQLRANLIPPSAAWRDEVLPALDRLDQLRASGKLYGNEIVDQDLVLEFQRMLDEFEPNIKMALIIAATLAPEVKPSGRGTQIFDALSQVSKILSLTADAREDFIKLSALVKSHSPELAQQAAGTLDQIEIIALEKRQKSRASAETTKKLIKGSWQKARERFSRQFQEGTARFNPEFVDVFSAIKGSGAGKELGTDFSAKSAMDWTNLLSRSLVEDELPAWLRVATALELGLLDLAAELVKTVPDDPDLMTQWVEERRLRSADLSKRQNALVISLGETSTATWKPSPRNGSLVTGDLKLAELSESFAKHNLGFQPDLMAIELPEENEKALEILAPRPSVIPWLRFAHKNVKVVFFRSTPLEIPPDLQIIFCPAPKGIDDLFEAAIQPPPTPSAA
jgi:hypothetical protein